MTSLILGISVAMMTANGSSVEGFKTTFTNNGLVAFVQDLLDMRRITLRAWYKYEFESFEKTKYLRLSEIYRSKVFD